MEVLFLPGETIFLTFQLTNGSGWLTNNRLIIVEHTPGELNQGNRQDYFLKNFEKAQIKNTTLTAQFKDKKAKIKLPLFAPSILQEIKNYLEETAKHFKH